MTLTRRFLCPLLALLLVPFGALHAATASNLESGFLNPPDSAKPQTWWHWRDGRINKEAITAELEAMKRIGIGGVTMFSASSMGETGPKVVCLSPDWHDRVRFAVQECDRLGLSFNFQNCAGWNGSGGPWITPDKAMQHVTAEKRAVKGGATIQWPAPPSWPESGRPFYRDIAILAFPTPAACEDAQPLPSPKVTTSGLTGDPALVNDPEKPGDVTDKTPALSVDTTQSAWVEFEFPSAVTCRSVMIAGKPQINLPDDQRATVLASDDGVNFREIVRLSTYKSLCGFLAVGTTHAIPQTTARFFRLAWEGPVKLALRRVAWSSQPAIYSGESKMGEIARTLVSEPVLATEEGTAVPLEGVVDLTSKLDARGNLSWTAPAGNWTVVRVGYHSGTRVNAPAPPEATGLECDKFNPETVAFHFDHYAAKILEDAAGLKAPGAMVFDSWEAQSQNWSPVFREEFRKRRGYDVLRYLPVFAGVIVENRDVTDRFLRDVRQTMSDLIAENFFGKMSELAHERGLEVHSESVGGSGAGTMVADALTPYLHVDVPMNEFGWPLKEAVSAAHVSGKSVVALEAFTQSRVDWRTCPASLKAAGDGAYCAGITRFVFHTYSHNPDLNLLSPGPAFGPYGMGFSRGQTWWEMGGPWIKYLTRCQYLLQRGKAAEDVLYFYGEEPAGPLITVFGGDRRNADRWTALPDGFDYDLLPAETLIKNLSFRNGQLTLPDGTAYRLLALRDSDRMTPEAAAKIKELVKAGATVVGPKPRRSPSLTDYPHCDGVVRKIGDEVWGDCDGKKVTAHDFGKGRVYWNRPLNEVLDELPLAPDFSATSGGKPLEMRFIHRRDGDADIYFIASVRDYDTFDAAFRVSGKQPEIWDPLTGQTHDATAFRQQDGRTILPLRFDRVGSLFVIFRKSVASGAAGQGVRNLPEFQEKLTLKEPWNVAFTPGWGAPESVTFAELTDWSKRPEPGIRYYSGTAVYKTGFDWNAAEPGAFYLDLGKVDVIAGVKLNGVDCGIAWTWPYRVDVSRALKPGRNELEIRVANTWLNRLEGEGRVEGAALHAWTPSVSYPGELPLAESGLLGPVRMLVGK